MIHLNDQAARMLVGPGGTVGVGDVDIGLGKAPANARELPGLIQDFKDQDLLFHHIKPFPFQEKKGLRGVVHQEPDHGIVDGIVDRQGEDIDAAIRENGAGARQIAGPVF